MLKNYLDLQFKSRDNPIVRYTEISDLVAHQVTENEETQVLKPQ
jgi:hypothetical protein